MNKKIIRVPADSVGDVCVGFVKFYLRETGNAYWGAKGNKNP